jgi:regulator of nucleoside diphosphate kinase
LPHLDIGANVDHRHRIIVSRNDFELLRVLAGHARLAAELAGADILETRLVPHDVVTMNSRVRFEDESTGEIRDVTIVFPNEVGASPGRVSVLATVGTALLGLAAGQSVLWPFPDGSLRKLHVLKLIHQARPDEYANG